MKNAKRTWLIIWPVVLLTMVVASCAHQGKSSVNEPVTGMFAGGGGGPVHGGVDSPPSAMPQTAQPGTRYYSTIGDETYTSTYNGYQPNNVMPPKKFGYVDGVDRHPNPTAPRK